MNEETARRRVRQLRRFYGGLTAYVPVITGLFLINLLTSPGQWWFFYPAIGWGIGIGISAIKTFGLFGVGNSDWEEQKVAQLTGKTPAQAATQDELTRLSARVEALATIVSSRRWDAATPLMAEAEQALSDVARPAAPTATPTAAALPPTPLDRERLIALVQHLETLVTSPEFERLERTPPRSRDGLV